MMAVAVSTTPTFSIGRPVRLFDGEGVFAGRGHNYDVTTDGQRFVVAEQVEGGDSTIHVVQNWYEEFRDREQD